MRKYKVYGGGWFNSLFHTDLIIYYPGNQYSIGSNRGIGFRVCKLTRKWR